MGTLSRRRFVVGAAGAGLLAGCGRWPWQAEQPGVKRLVILSFGDQSTSVGRLEWFQQALHEHGWDEGRNLAVESRHADSQLDRIQGLAAEVVQLTPDVVLAVGTPSVRALKDTTTTIPVVLVSAGDPVGAGLVASLARPGGNLTGLSNFNPQLIEKRLELLKETVPSGARVGVLWNPALPNRAGDYPVAEAAARTLGVRVVPLAVETVADFETAFETALGERVDALFVIPNFMFDRHAPRIADFAAQHRLATSAADREFVVAGGLMSLATRTEDQYRRAAYYVDRILKGTKPADLPVEQPMTFDFVVNLKTAQALGIIFPNEIMLQVTEVIQ